MTHVGEKARRPEARYEESGDNAVKASGSVNRLSTGLQTGGTIPGGGGAASVGSIGTGGGSTGRASTGNAGYGD